MQRDWQVPPARGSAPTRRTALAALIAVASGIVGQTATGKRRKRKKITLCVNGQSVRVKQSARGSYLAQGATVGACRCTTCAAQGKICGPISDGCGGALACGSCGSGERPSCNNGTCFVCSAVCPPGCSNCLNRADGATTCSLSSAVDCTQPCTTDADCTAPFSTCVVTSTDRATNVTTRASLACPPASAPGVCATLESC